MTQATRNKIYGVVAAVLTVLVTLGVVDQATSDEATTLANAVLDQAEGVLGLVAAITAFVKSLPSRVSTVDKDGNPA